MKTNTKIHIASLILSVGLCSLNWHYEIKYDRTYGVLSEANAPVGAAYLSVIALAICLFLSCAHALKQALIRGTKIEWRGWFYSKLPFFYPLPLLFHHIRSSDWRESDGAWAHRIGGYGHPLSSKIFIFALICIALIQIRELLKNRVSDEST
jgi:hypothetical protein